MHKTTMENSSRITGEDFDKKYFSSGSYKAYEKNVASWVAAAARVIKKLLKGIKKPSVLDAGCAHGYLIAVLRDKYGISVRGLEHSDYAVKTAASSVKKKIKKGSVLNEKLFTSNLFNVVVCFDVFQYFNLSETRRAARNLARWSKKYIVFSTIYRHSIHASQKINPDPFRITALTQKEYKKIFAEAGARFVKKVNFGNGGDVFIFQKK